MPTRTPRFSTAIAIVTVACLLLGQRTGLFQFRLAETAAGCYYVAPPGHTTGDGSMGTPWDLQTALSVPPAVRPGDTIWLRGGTYAGAAVAGYSFACSLKGTAGLPISVRQYPGERATIDGRGAVYGTI